MVASPKPNLEGLISIDDLHTVSRFTRKLFVRSGQNSSCKYKLIFRIFQTGGSQIEKYARDTLDPSLSWKVLKNLDPYANYVSRPYIKCFSIS